MKKLKTILIIFIILISCSKNSKPDHVKQANKILTLTSKELEKKFNLHLIITGGSMMDDIKILTLGFTSNKAVNIDQARKLIMSCALIFLDNINNSSEIRPYLHNYPSTEKNIQMELYFQTNGKALEPPYIAVVGLSNGEIVYYHKYKYLKEIYRESYEEALKKNR